MNFLSVLLKTVALKIRHKTLLYSGGRGGGGISLPFESFVSPKLVQYKSLADSLSFLQPRSSSPYMNKSDDFTMSSILGRLRRVQHLGSAAADTDHPLALESSSSSSSSS